MVQIGPTWFVNYSVIVPSKFLPLTSGNYIFKVTNTNIALKCKLCLKAIVTYCILLSLERTLLADHDTNATFPLKSFLEKFWNSNFRKYIGFLPKQKKVQFFCINNFDQMLNLKKIILKHLSISFMTFLIAFSKPGKTTHMMTLMR